MAIWSQDYLWVVEECAPLEDGTPRWLPLIFNATYTRRAARRDCEACRKTNPGQAFRVRKYVRAESGDR